MSTGLRRPRPDLIHRGLLGVALVFMASCRTSTPTDAGVEPDGGAVLDGGALLDGGTPDAGLPVDVLEIQLFGVPQNTPADAVLYATGTFNQWNAADAASALIADGTGAFVTRVGGLRAGDVVEFKFTRGAWATVEKAESGAERPNRSVVFDPAFPRVAAFVAKWADLPLPPSSRTGELQTFSVGGRNVWVYLPPRLASSPARVPVLYAFDAQNLFDRAGSSTNREWQLDETLERLVRERRLPPVMVVGLESTAARTCEYNVFASDPHPGCASGAALGDATIAFVADTLKPRIDGDYPTLASAADTAVMGSSMGGSLAMRAGFSRPDVFSRVAALSPSYQNTASSTPQMPAYIGVRGAQPLRVHQDMGTAEQFRDLMPAVLLANAQGVDRALVDAGFPAAQHRLLEIAGGTHDEGAWAARVDQVLPWLWAR